MTEHINGAMRAYEAMKEKGWTEGDIASLADYLDQRQRKLVQEAVQPLADRIKWHSRGFIVLAVWIPIAPNALKEAAKFFGAG